MSTWIHVVFFLLFTMYLVKNGLSFGNSSESSIIPSMIHHFNDTKINIVVITITSGMSSSDPPLSFFYNDQQPRIYLEPEKTFTKFTNFDRKVILMFWDALCIIFYGYDPDSEGNHQRIHWLAKPEGLFHSWDNQNWEKKKTWNNDDCS
ncbi:hypothetical protein Fmac_022927 [Flemingia macrophylla]|uniref:S-protein homolog n=1 Tax=Flemingia macrophylla TaxID=520843 RepID=A0ABD1LK19_9FABA